MADVSIINNDRPKKLKNSLVGVLKSRQEDDVSYLCFKTIPPWNLN
jgi:hypothetical protein